MVAQRPTRLLFFTTFANALESDSSGGPIDGQLDAIEVTMEPGMRLSQLTEIIALHDSTDTEDLLLESPDTGCNRLFLTINPDAVVDTKVRPLSKRQVFIGVVQHGEQVPAMQAAALATIANDAFPGVDPEDIVFETVNHEEERGFSLTNAAPTVAYLDTAALPDQTVQSVIDGAMALFPHKKLEQLYVDNSDGVAYRKVTAREEDGPFTCRPQQRKNGNGIELNLDYEPANKLLPHGLSLTAIVEVAHAEFPTVPLSRVDMYTAISSSHRLGIRPVTD